MAVILEDTAAGETVTDLKRDTNVHVGPIVQARESELRSAHLMRIRMDDMSKSFNYVFFNCL